MDHNKALDTEGRMQHFARRLREQGLDSFEVDQVLNAAREDLFSAEGPELEEGEAEMTRELQQLRAESTPSDGTSTEHPFDAAKRAMEEARKSGKSRERSQEAWFETVMDAASRGDRRVLLDVDAPYETR